MTVKEPSSLYTVRFNDCDPFGHLNNSSYINYFMNAREDHLAESYNLHLKDLAAKVWDGWCTQHQISYIKPALWRKKCISIYACWNFPTHHILVEMWMTDEQKKKSEILLWSRFAHIDLKTGKRPEYDEALLKLLDEILVEHNGVKTTFDQRVGAVLQSLLTPQDTLVNSCR